MPPKKQKLVFFLVVGSALFIVGIVSFLGRRVETVEQDATSLPEATSQPEFVVSDILDGKQTWNGLEITILNYTKEGWPLIEAQNHLNEPPLEGKKMLLITVEVKRVKGAGEDPAGEEPVSITASDFTVVGDFKEVYTTYNEHTRCGVIPDRLDGVVTYDYSISGSICVQVPEDEGGFILVYDDYSGGDPAVYIPLPEGE